MAHPFLSLKNITLDLELIHLIPYQLAYYHLALPVAEDDQQITLVMAHPDNPKVVALFENHFQRKIIPVQGDGDEIRATLDLLAVNHTVSPEKQFLSWSSSASPETLRYTQEIARAFSELAVCMDASQNSLASVLNILHEGNYHLAVIDMPEVGELLKQSNTSLLLLRGSQPIFRRILIALQGHSPDKHSIALVTPLAQTFDATVTILGIAAPMKRTAVQGIATLLDPSTHAGAHLQECLEQAHLGGLNGLMKVRQGLPEAQIAAEFAEGEYDLLAIAVETYGGFVQRVLQNIQELMPHNQAPILAVKPLL